MKTKFTLEKLFNSFFGKIGFMIFAAFLMISSIVCSQVSINFDDSPPDPSAMLDVQATGLGFLAPRMTVGERPGSPTTGLLIYQTNSSPGYYYFDGSDWQKVGKNTWLFNSDDIYYLNGNVSIGTSYNDGNSLRIQNSVDGKAAVFGRGGLQGQARGYLGVSNASNSQGLPSPFNNLDYIGVLGTKPANNKGAGIVGWSNGDSDNNFGGIFIADGSTSGLDINYGVYGYAANGSINFAGYFDGFVKVTDGMQVLGTANIGGGPVPSGYTMSVHGKVICEELLIAEYANWPDYVFSNDYPLLSIDEFEQSILENNHLPGMTSADEIANNAGFLIGDVQKKMLEKIEELSLYIIELNGRLKKLEYENEELKEMSSIK